MAKTRKYESYMPISGSGSAIYLLIVFCVFFLFFLTFLGGGGGRGVGSVGIYCTFPKTQNILRAALTFASLWANSAKIDDIF